MTVKPTKQKPVSPQTQYDLFDHLVRIVSSTNGISLQETLELATRSSSIKKKRAAYALLGDFRQHLSQFQQYSEDIEVLLSHPVGHTLSHFFRMFPIPYQDEHTHLTGSLTPEFIYPKLVPLLQGTEKKTYRHGLQEVYGKDCLPISSPQDIKNLIQIKEGDRLLRYLETLYLAKLILRDRQTHREAALHMAQEMYEHYNVGSIRLKFTLSRSSNMKAERIPGLENATPEHVLLGLYEGFMDFKKTHPFFQFVLSPSFKKEDQFYDSHNFATKEEDFTSQVETLLALLQQYPELQSCVTDIDTVGDDREMYRKAHFVPMQRGIRKLQQYGFKVRSHHGETWHTLNQGIQAVDNAMNIWHIDSLEHGLSLGINPNSYFHTVFENVREQNIQGAKLDPASPEGKEIMRMEWGVYKNILDKLRTGKLLTAADVTHFVRVKFSTAIEVEHYQHDVLNRMIDQEIDLTSLPSSNRKLSGTITDFRNHPFSWWEKKGVQQGIGTDNYVTLGTNFLREMVILMLSDPKNLKIMKLLMVATGEERRPYLSKTLWDMRKQLKKEFA
jgi:hypothetical protein